MGHIACMGEMRKKLCNDHVGQMAEILCGFP
jgi:hypothetical protein